MDNAGPEPGRIPASLLDELREVEAQIREAFAGVRRGDGRSWSEAIVIDQYGSEEEMTSARASEKKDQYRRWEKLVDDPNWDEDVGFHYLDAVGFRYYIAPGIVRCLRRGYYETVAFALEHASPEFIELLDEPQTRAVARFIRFMVKVNRECNDDVETAEWEQLYFYKWRQWDDPAERH